MAKPRSKIPTGISLRRRFDPLRFAVGNILHGHYTQMHSALEVLHAMNSLQAPKPIVGEGKFPEAAGHATVADHLI